MIWPKISDEMKFDTDDLSLAFILYVLAFGAGQNVSLKIADLIYVLPFFLFST